MRTIRDWMMILIFDFYSYSHVPRARTFAMFFVLYIGYIFLDAFRLYITFFLFAVMNITFSV
jgi:hypothetical protein